MTKPIALSFILISAAVASGCISPQYGPAPFACAQSLACPEGYKCQSGVCRSNSSSENVTCSTIGAEETKACGNCDTGQTKRTCLAEGRWSDWQECQGSEKIFPINPTNKNPVCPPYNQPMIFFSPHPAEVILGAAASIWREIHTNKRTVFLELLTQGENSAVRTQLANNQTCTWHEGAHSYSLTETEFGQAYTAELLAAAASLGVSGVVINSYAAGNVSRANVDERLAFWKKNSDQGKTFYWRGPAGSLDPSKSNSKQFEHDYLVVAEALAPEQTTADVAYYFVQLSPANNIDGSPNLTFTLTSEEVAAKTAALATYQLWTPAAGRYAIGYHALSSTFDAWKKFTAEYWWK